MCAETMTSSERDRFPLIEAALASASDGIVIVDMQGAIVSANEAGRWLVGRHPPRELLEQGAEADLRPYYPDGSRIPEDDLPLARALRGETVAGMLVMRHKPDGAAYFSVSASPVKGTEGQMLGTVATSHDITEQVRGEEALRESEQRFRSVVAQSRDGIILTDENGTIIEWSDGQERITGLKREEVMGRPVWDVRHQATREELRTPERYQSIKATIQEVLQTGHFLRAYQPIEAVVRHPDGTQRAVEDLFFPIKTRKGFLICSISRDITERKRADEAIRFQAHLLDAVDQAVIVTDLQGKIIYWNRFAETMYGWRAWEAVGHQITELILPENMKEQADKIIPKLAAGERRSGEFPVQRRDGTVFPALVTNSPVYDEDGELMGIVGVSQDISERKQAEKRLKELTEQAERRADEMDAVYAALADAVIVFDPDGIAIKANPAAIRALGLDPVGPGAEMLAQQLSIHYPDGRLVPLDELPYSRALRGKTVVNERFHFTSVDGRPSEGLVSASPLMSNDSMLGIVMVWHDITELSELDRLKDQFIEVAAHELKTPLTVMRGYAQSLLRQAGDLLPAQRSMLEAVNRGTSRINGIVNDLLDISQLQQGRLRLEKERLELAALVEQVANEMALVSPHHRFRVGAKERVIVEGDRHRLREVVSHFIDNAVRYSPKGEYIDVAVGLQNDEAIVAVKDYGVGIPREKQARIFQRFYRAHTNTPYDYGGIGVGLYISKEIITRHGGRMWFESEEGKGSTFCFSLPISSRSDA